MERLFLRNSFRILISIAIVFFANKVYPAFENVGVGVRPIGLGGSYVAIADDINATLWNVAGLTQLTKVEITTMYSKLYWGIEEDNLSKSFIGFGYPISSDIGIIGLSWINFNSNLYGENTIVLSYARNIIENLSSGINVKTMIKKYGTNGYTDIDPVFAGGKTAYGIGLDFGALYKLSDNFSLGASINNLNQPDISLKEKDLVPLDIKTGLAVKLGNISIFENILMSTEFDWYNNINKDYKVCSGIESWFFDKIISLRIGGSSGNNKQGEITTGMSYVLNRETWQIEIDYAFSYLFSGAMVGTSGNHHIATTLKF